jgi:hypothetical protein
VLKLTSPAGKSFWVRTTAITVIREPNEDEYPGECKAVVIIGALAFAVKEPVASLALTLGAG